MGLTEFPERQVLLSDRADEALALHALHDENRHAGVFLDQVHGDDVRMIDGGGHPHGQHPLIQSLEEHQ